MNTLNFPAAPVNLRLFNPDDASDASLDDFDQIEGLETSAWIRDQAERFRVMGSELAGLVAERIEDLAREWSVLSQGEPISVEDFRSREEVMRELALSPDYS